MVMTSGLIEPSPNPATAIAATAHQIGGFNAKSATGAAERNESVNASGRRGKRLPIEPNATAPSNDPAPTPPSSNPRSVASPCQVRAYTGSSTEKSGAPAKFAI